MLPQFLFMFFVNSAEVNPEHHVRILEALITAGGLIEMQAAPGRIRNVQMHKKNVTKLFFCHRP